ASKVQLDRNVRLGPYILMVVRYFWRRYQFYVQFYPPSIATLRITTIRHGRKPLICGLSRDYEGLFRYAVSP
ncbi:MAG: hypothetical protein KAT56_11895, partial [Sedimentisphaerales bacterium]|nr:hypothetical protein [Sedimentisphaerales bacterium]